MKRWLSSILVLVISIFMVACSGSSLNAFFEQYPQFSKLKAFVLDMEKKGYSAELVKVPVEWKTFCKAPKGYEGDEDIDFQCQGTATLIPVVKDEFALRTHYLADGKVKVVLGDNEYILYVLKDGAHMPYGAGDYKEWKRVKSIYVLTPDGRYALLNGEKWDLVQMKDLGAMSLPWRSDIEWYDDTASLTYYTADGNVMARVSGADYVLGHNFTAGRVWILKENKLMYVDRQGEHEVAQLKEKLAEKIGNSVIAANEMLPMHRSSKYVTDTGAIYLPFPMDSGIPAVTVFIDPDKKEMKIYTSENKNAMITLMGREGDTDIYWVEARLGDGDTVVAKYYPEYKLLVSFFRLVETWAGPHI
ncbi:MAG: hypothetical protein GXO59_02110 [Dictyoglomi bacterium]|nr:hypothetical protein [Dictyoglomota bacterium]